MIPQISCRTNLIPLSKSTQTLIDMSYKFLEDWIWKKTHCAFSTMKVEYKNQEPNKRKRTLTTVRTNSPKQEERWIWREIVWVEDIKEDPKREGTYLKCVICL